jgi:transaldolase/glucose-6-phosphate isomerase
MQENPIRRLTGLGQSLWLDFIRRNLIASGGLKRLIEEDDLRGVTSNPSIFEKSIDGSKDYDEDVRALAEEGKSVEEVYSALTLKDIRDAADVFRPVYDRLEGRDGFVSLEVSPHLAHDTEGTIAEARHLWKALDRPNVFIKIPATREGLAAVQRCIGEGINVNVTLLFGLPRYREVTEAFLAGMEERAGRGEPLERVASVASFFLSRIDVLVDPVLEKAMETQGSQAELARSLHGQVAVASAKLAYRIYQEVFHADRFRRLADKGARPQRVLWASTSTKNPSYSDVKYVEALIGPDTVNTVPMETLNAYRDHGDPKPRLEEDPDEARRVMEQLPALDIDIDRVTRQLEDEGVEKFNQPYDRLMKSLEKKRRAVLCEPVDPQTLDLGDAADAVEKRLKRLEKQSFVERLWRKDASLWKRDPEEQKVVRNGLGWLHVAEKMTGCLAEIQAFSHEVRDAGFQRIVHMGMGGSSLTPLVFERTFGSQEGGLPLTVLDTTDPATIHELETTSHLTGTLFIVASKSGTTTEPLAFGEYFFERLRERRGDRAGQNFVAITDPDTPLVRLAKARGFLRTFLNFQDIGGRYSALSYFGMVPAALMGLDVAELLERALCMTHACAPSVPARDNPGVVLGTALAEMARLGRNKITFLLPPSIGALGLWLEQLLAESTGKEGKGLVPVAGEPVGDPSVYGEDRVFVHVRLAEEEESALDRNVQALRDAGHPVIAIRLNDRLDLAQEFFRWEMATATAGSILGINAFNQPNVQESKDNAKKLLDEFGRKGKLPLERPTLSVDGLEVHAQQKGNTLHALLSSFLRKARTGDYIALLAYLTETEEHQKTLQAIREELRNALRLSTTLGYGPRYLHSTGQLHKGGPNRGMFLEMTGGGAENLPIPGKGYGFETLKGAQDIGDFKALRKHRRRVLRIDLGKDVAGGLSLLKRAVSEALTSL